MIVPDVIRSLFGSGDDSSPETVIYECRQCGTKAEERLDRCPECGGEEIARYEFDGERGAQE